MEILTTIQKDIKNWLDTSRMGIIRCLGILKYLINLNSYKSKRAIKMYIRSDENFKLPRNKVTKELLNYVRLFMYF